MSKAPPLWKHQKQTIAKGEKTPRFLDFSDPGTGKTRGHIEIFAARRKKRGGCALVLCPRTLMKTAWGNDITKYAPELSYSICYADSDIVPLVLECVKDLRECYDETISGAPGKDAEGKK